MKENDFWEYSLEVYGNARAAEACLALQNNCQANANLLLFFTWIARRHGRLIDLAACALCDRCISGIDTTIVSSLRSARQAIDKMTTDPALQEIRKKILDLELEAENLVQSRLFELTPTLIDQCPGSNLTVEEKMRHNLETYGIFLNRAFPEDDVNSLIRYA
ncbi:TIGR02444 family protein [Emcibacter nanhaiensis]|uniref:TIGR02444 family protein n=1 Tax=Emcibacter nanhaiensis TaxID=1505037 RepID=A0A501PBN6_9PROT|nr:TIGR02444 family protein [Emcibacter nanhaiensis]TPD57770.1 TIGR02444 family protein [Emcibacter nanhaiensis]